MGIIGLVKLFVIFTIIGLSHGECICKKKMIDAGIIPTYADDVCRADDVTVSYGGKSIKCGDPVPYKTAQYSPTVGFDVQGKCAFASVAVFNPDADKGPFLMALNANVDPGQLKAGVNLYGKPYSYRIRVRYPPVTNRIVFFIYCQKTDKIDLMDFPPDSDAIREYWKPKDFAGKYNLGYPLGGYFFTIKYPWGKANPN